jgi:hypothetical protein
MRSNSKPIPTTIIHQIAVLAKIQSPGQIIAFEKLLKVTLTVFCAHAHGLRTETPDRKLAKDIFKFANELSDRLAVAGPRLRHLLTSPRFPDKPAPRSLDDLTSAVTTLREMSRFAVMIPAHKQGLTAAFIRGVYEDAELCGGHFTGSKAMHGTLKSALDLLRPYLPKEIETDVSPDTVFRATRKRGKTSPK